MLNCGGSFERLCVPSTALRMDHTTLRWHKGAVCGGPRSDPAGLDHLFSLSAIIPPPHMPRFRCSSQPARHPQNDLCGLSHELRRLRARFAVCRMTVLVTCGVFGLMSPAAGAAQVRVTATLLIDDVRAGTGSSCTWTVAKLIEAPDPANAQRLKRVSDSVQVRIVNAKDSLTPAGAELYVQVGSGQRYTMPAADSTRTFAVGEREIAARRVVVSRSTNAPGAALCAAVPEPLWSASRNLGVTHHDLFAGGEVSNALRTGANVGAATGSLGLHSFSYRSDTNVFVFPFGFLPSTRSVRLNAFTGFLKKHLSYQADLEELQTSVTVAGQGDTLFGATPNAAFAQAVLAPLTAPRGNLSSVQVMYSPQTRYGSTQTSLRGFRFAAGATRSAWQGVIHRSIGTAGVTDTAARDTIAKNVTLFTGDVRWRWVFINRTRDEDGNTFSFAMDAGATFRGIAGDIVAESPRNDALRAATLGTTAKSFWGPVAGLYLTLRQVSAFAEIQRLGARDAKAQPRVESLEGWQPIIGFRFEAPIFSINGRAAAVEPRTP